MTLTLLTLGAVCWLLTTIVVESDLFAPLRQFVRRKAMPTRSVLTMLTALFTTGAPPIMTRRQWAWDKLSMLLTCHLCTGVWVGLGLAALVQGPFDASVSNGVLSTILDGFAYKAIGHLVLVAVNAVNAYTKDAEGPWRPQPEVINISPNVRAWPMEHVYASPVVGQTGDIVDVNES